MMIRRVFFNVATDDLRGATRLYREILGFEVVFSSDWFVQLQAPHEAALELGFLRKEHEIVPPSARRTPVGGFLTIVVDDVDEVHRAVVGHGYTVVEPPRNLFYGQRRMVVIDSNGLTLDISSECAPDPEWMARVRPTAGGGYVED